MNPMRQLRIAKVTLNCGSGKDQKKLERSVRLLKLITGIEPVKTISTKRIPGWGLRPGLPVGCKITLRGKQAEEIFTKLMKAKENTLSAQQIDEHGNVAFGIPEYIEIPGVEYDPDIGILGFQVCLTIERPGYRIKRRRLQQRKVPASHRVQKEEVQAFLEEKFDIRVKAA